MAGDTQRPLNIGTQVSIDTMGDVHVEASTSLKGLYGITLFGNDIVIDIVNQELHDNFMILEILNKYPIIPEFKGRTDKIKVYYEFNM
jgi:hypothetical protein